MSYGALPLAGPLLLGFAEFQPLVHHWVKLRRRACSLAGENIMTRRAVTLWAAAATFSLSVGPALAAQQSKERPDSRPATGTATGTAVSRPSGGRAADLRPVAGPADPQPGQGRLRPAAGLPPACRRVADRARGRTTGPGGALRSAATNAPPPGMIRAVRERELAPREQRRCSLAPAPGIRDGRCRSTAVLVTGARRSVTRSKARRPPVWWQRERQHHLLSVLRSVLRVRLRIRFALRL